MCFLISILSGAERQSLCNLRNSLGYSRSTWRTQLSKLLLVYLFNSKSIGSACCLLEETKVLHNHINYLHLSIMF